jgi:hypothetical protein
MTSKILNAVLFQLVWFACVWGGASGHWWLAVASVTGFALWQVPRSATPKTELALMGAAVFTGLVVDTAYVAAGLVSYPQPGPWRGVAPVWIIALWVGFALTLNHSLAWLKGRPLAAAVMGGLAGPFSFWIGATRFEAAEFVAPAPLVLVILGAGWALLLPGLFALAGRLESPQSPNIARHPHSSLQPACVAAETRGSGTRNPLGGGERQ